jgi:hypothetical protein
MTATTVATVTREKPRVGAYDRVFYTGMAVTLALTVLAGFGPTYYLRFLSGGPTTTVTGGPFTILLHAHGALFTAWVGLFIVQTGLVARHRVAVHRRLGVAGGVLALSMVVVGTLTAIDMAARGAAPPGIDPRAFLAIPLFDMVLFSTFVGAALMLRRNKEAHKRLMLLAYISIVVAAVARLPGILPLGPLVFFGLTFVFVIAAMIYDAASRRRVHPAYLWGGGLFALSVPVRLTVSGTTAWQAFAQLLT